MRSIIVALLICFQGLNIVKSQGLTPFHDENFKIGFKDQNGQTVIQPKYTFVRWFSENLAIVNMDGKEYPWSRYGGDIYFTEGNWGIIDTTGKEVLALTNKYETINDFHCGLALVLSKGKFGFIDKTGNEIIPPKYNIARSFSNGLAAVNIGSKSDEDGELIDEGKWGYIDSTGKEVIAIKYDLVEDFDNYGFGVVINSIKDSIYNLKHGVIDRTGKEVVPLKYFSIDNWRIFQMNTENGIKTGYFDPRSFKEIIPAKYDKIQLYMCGIASVMLNGKYGFVDQITGKELIPPKYDGDLSSSFSEGFAKVILNDKYFFVDKFGNEFAEDDYISSYSRGRYIQVNLKSQTIFIDSTGKKYEISNNINQVHDVFENVASVDFADHGMGIIDIKTGKEIFKCTDCVPNDGHHNGNKFLQIFLDNGLIKVKVSNGGNDKYGLFSTNGKMLLDTIYSYIYPFIHGVAVIGETDINDSITYIRKGLINRYGDLIMPVKYQRIEFNDDSDIGIARESKSINSTISFYIDTTGKKISPYDFEDAEFPMKDRIAKVKLNNQYGIINSKMEVIVPFRYNEIGYNNNGLLPAQLGNKWGVILEQGKVVIPFKYQSVTIINKDLILCENEKNLIGLKDGNGKTIASPIYSADGSYRLFENIKGSTNTLMTKLDGKYGIINYKGDILIPFKYDDFVEPEYDRYHLYGLVVTLNGKKGIINRNGTGVTPIKYDEITYDFDGHGTCQYALVKVENKWGCIDTKTGKELISPKYERIYFISDANPSSDSTVIYNIRYCAVSNGSNYDTIRSDLEYKKISENDNWQIKEQRSIDDSTIIIAYGGGKWCLADLRGNELTPMKYDKIRIYMRENRLPVKLNNKWGFIDELGKEVLPVIYETIDNRDQDYFYEGRTNVMIDGRKFYIDLKGNEISD